MYHEMIKRCQIRDVVWTRFAYYLLIDNGSIEKFLLWLVRVGSGSSLSAFERHVLVDSYLLLFEVDVWLMGYLVGRWGLLVD